MMPLRDALEVMAERAGALQQSPLVTYDDETETVVIDEAPEVAAMLLQGVNASAKEVLGFIDIYADRMGLWDHRGALIEMFVIGSLVGQVER